jgi:hypothetical protein
MKLSATLLLIGVAIVGYAYSLAPYTDEAAFLEQYTALAQGQSTEYWELRNKMLTPKFQFEDYGGTLIAIGIGGLLVSLKGWRKLKSPTSRTMLLGIGFAAALLTAGAYVFDLFQAYGRGEFPPWADSMGIPLLGVPVLLVALLVWAGAQLVFLRGEYHSTPLALALSRKSNWWLLSISAVTAALVALSIMAGQYWYAIPGVAWLYFYTSLAADLRAAEA